MRPHAINVKALKIKEPFKYPEAPDHVKAWIGFQSDNIDDLLKSPLVVDNRKEWTQPPREWTTIKVDCEHRNLRLRYVPLNELKETQHYTDPMKVTRYVDQIKKGTFEAITLVGFDMLWVADGHHRIKALRNLGFQTVPAVIISAPKGIRHLTLVER